ncbi:MULTISPECIES: hypothetical protein [unclassified Nocardia]|uniref:hypothetical protein n=1 Tax=unclassified Nocardia TaxID=2637762 RepID=UPI00278C8D00|nr:MULTISPECIES: hypothetical protein [unclassified Nocardia]
MAEGDNPWSGLAQQARQGQLRITETAAREAANFAADSVYSLTSVGTYVSFVKEHKGFSDNNHLQKALALASRFDAQGRRLEESLGKFIDLVTAMGETLMIAGKLYDDAETDSKAAFDGLGPAAAERDRSMLGPSPRYGQIEVPMPDGRKTAAEILSSNYSDVKAVGTGADDPNLHFDDRYADPIDPEDPNGHTGHWFQTAREGMDPQKVANSSGDWRWIADRIDEDFDNLTGRLERIEQDEQWSGQGAAAAIAAAKRFKAQANDLTTDMRSISRNLLYAAEWLWGTQQSLPRNVAQYSPEIQESLVQSAIQGWKRYYIPGLTASSLAIPKLADPTAPPPSLDPGGNNNGGNNNGGGTGGATGGGGTGGGGTGGGGTGGGGTGGGDRGLSADLQRQLAAARQAGLPPDAENGSPRPNTPSPDANRDPRGSQSDSRTGGQQGQQVAQQLQSAVDQGLQSAQQAAEQAQQALAQQAQNDVRNQLANAPLAGMPAALNDLAKKVGAGGPKGGGGAPGGGGPQTQLSANSPASKLFPRAALSVDAVGTVRAGLATGAGMPMSGPMGPAGAPGAGAQNQGKEHKRPDFLDSDEHLADAIGEPPIVAKPVVEG